MIKSDDGIAAEPKSSASTTAGELDLVLMMRLKALEIDEILGSVTGQMDNYVHLAELYTLRGDMDRAASMFEQALHVTNRLGADESAGQAFLVLGAICLARGDIERGEPLIRRAADIFAGVQNPRLLVLTTRLMARVLQHQGSWEEAELMLENAVAAERGYCGSQVLASCLSELGLLYLRRAKVAAARSALQEALNLWDVDEGDDGRGTCLGHLAVAHILSGDLADAETLLGQAIKLNRHPDRTRWLADNLANLGNLCWMTGRHEEAQQHYQSARHLFIAEGQVQKAQRVGQLLKGLKAATANFSLSQQPPNC